MSRKGRPYEPARSRRAGRRAARALSALDPLRLAGAALFLAFWEAASLFVSPIILPGPLSACSQRAATDFWSAPALSYFGLEDPSLAGNLLYTAENVAIAALLGTAIGVTLGLLSAQTLVRARGDGPGDDDGGDGADPDRRAVPADLVRRRPHERGEPRHLLCRGDPLRLRPARGAESRPDLRALRADARRRPRARCWARS